MYRAATLVQARQRSYDKSHAPVQHAAEQCAFKRGEANQASLIIRRTTDSAQPNAYAGTDGEAEPHALQDASPAVCEADCR